MRENHKIRFAVPGDSGTVLAIYAPFITGTAVTFECRVPSGAEFRERMAAVQKAYPWLVCEIDGAVVGYAYASPFHEREAYRWSADYSVYILPDYRRQHIGKALYSALTGLLKLQGFCRGYSLVTLPNAGSEALHESFGFRAVGDCRDAGYKLGGWHDVRYYELDISDPPPSPANPKTIGEIRGSEEVRSIFAKAEQILS